MAVIAILMLNYGINSSWAMIVDVTETSILSQDTNVNDPIKLRQAFAQVLVKNTGESIESILNNPVFRQANIKRAIKRSYFEKIDSQYLSENSPYHFWFHVVVQEAFLKQMIAEAGFSLLPANRNKIIIWMVKEEETVDLINSDPEASSQLEYVENDLVIKYWINHWAEALGMVVVYPQLDISDKDRVTQDSIKSLSFQAVDQSVNKYAVDQVLQVYIKKSTNLLRFRSGLVIQGNDIIINHYQEPIMDIGSLMYSLMADAAESIFQNSRINATDLLKHNVRVVINNINNYNQIMNIQNYLSSLSVIESYEIDAVSNGQMVLNVEMLIKTAVFLQLIEQNGLLLYQQDSPVNQLYFRVND